MQSTISNQNEDFDNTKNAENAEEDEYQLFIFDEAETVIEQSFAESDYIPVHGSMKRPAHPTVGFAEMKKGRLPWKSLGERLTVEVSTDEFTSVCPTTGQPDFNNITIEYTPDKYYLESKTIKFYFWSFRDFGAHCETLAQMILRHIAQAILPHSVKVRVNQNPRGGARIVSTAEWTKPAQTGLTVSTRQAESQKWYGNLTPEKQQIIKDALGKADVSKQ